MYRNNFHFRVFVKNLLQCNVFGNIFQKIFEISNGTVLLLTARFVYGTASSYNRMLLKMVNKWKMIYFYENDNNNPSIE